MKIKPKFKIGQWVHAKETVWFGPPPKGGNRRELRVKGIKATGQIVGATYRRIGDIHFSVYGDEQPHLTIESTCLVWQIKTGILNNPVEALQEDIVEAIGNRDGIPWKQTNPFPWSERAKANLREVMKEMPRDKKGRWTKL